MLIVIPKVLSSEEVKQFRSALDKSSWRDGSQSAGGIAIHVKHNRQLDDLGDTAQQLGREILRKISQHPVFISAALPDKIFPPKFNCYGEGETYGNHIDGSLMQIPGTAQTMRTDVSSTLFLNSPEEYEGGELQIHTQYGIQSVKLEAGDMVLYPSTSLHQVSPVTRGQRLASFFWTQSMVREDSQRQTLYELDQSIQNLSAELGSDHNQVTTLSGLYHNLIRRWASPS